MMEINMRCRSFFKLGGGEEFHCESCKVERDYGIFSGGLAVVLAYAHGNVPFSRRDNYDGLDSRK